MFTAMSARVAYVMTSFSSSSSFWIATYRKFPDPQAGSRICTEASRCTKSSSDF